MVFPLLGAKTYKMYYRTQHFAVLALTETMIVYSNFFFMFVTSPEEKWSIFPVHCFLHVFQR